MLIRPFARVSTDGSVLLEGTGESEGDDTMSPRPLGCCCCLDDGLPAVRAFEDDFGIAGRAEVEASGGGRGGIQCSETTSSCH